MDDETIGNEGMGGMSVVAGRRERGEAKPTRRGVVAGLTGGIASGKSTVARLFADFGAAVVSADEIARAVVEPGQPAAAEIRAVFGDDVFHADGRLHRERLGGIVFADETMRRKLESITHPHIRRTMAAQIDAAAATGRPVVAEIPLLFETGASRALVDVIIVVYAEEEQQLARLTARDGIDIDAARARLQSQLPLADKVAQADYVVDNTKDEAALRQQVKTIWHALCPPRS